MQSVNPMNAKVTPLDMLTISSLATVSRLGSVSLQQLRFLLLHCINCWLSEFREIFLCLLLHIIHTACIAR